MKRILLSLFFIWLTFTISGCQSKDIVQAINEDLGTIELKEIIGDYVEDDSFELIQILDELKNNISPIIDDNRNDELEVTTSYEKVEMEVHFIDVGQADCTLIICEGKAMLIDAGDNDKGTYVQQYLKKRGIEKLDIVIGTHPDADHYGGLDVILEKFPCEMILLPSYRKNTATVRDVYDVISHKNYTITTPIVGTIYPLGGANITIIGPNRDDYGDNVNNYSISVLLQYGDTKFLFTGDAEEAAELDMINTGLLLEANVYKVGHHGSGSSSSLQLLDAVNPDYAVISCGNDNAYGHPHASVLNTLRERQIKVFRTDEQGSIVAISNGKTITWNTAPSESWLSGR